MAIWRGGFATIPLSGRPHARFATRVNTSLGCARVRRVTPICPPLVRQVEQSDQFQGVGRGDTVPELRYDETHDSTKRPSVFPRRTNIRIGIAKPPVDRQTNRAQPFRVVVKTNHGIDEIHHRRPFGSSHELDSFAPSSIVATGSYEAVHKDVDGHIRNDRRAFPHRLEVPLPVAYRRGERIWREKSKDRVRQATRPVVVDYAQTHQGRQEVEPALNCQKRKQVKTSQFVKAVIRDLPRGHTAKLAGKFAALMTSYERFRWQTALTKCTKKARNECCPVSRHVWIGHVPKCIAAVKGTTEEVRPGTRLCGS